MICQPCRDGHHPECPELARQAKIAERGILQMPLVMTLAIETGQLCDCHHEPGSAIS